MADQYDIVEIPLHELVHQVVDLLYMVHPFLYTFPMAEDRRRESLMARLVQMSDDRGPVRARMPQPCIKTKFNINSSPFGIRIISFRCKNGDPLDRLFNLV